MITAEQKQQIKSENDKIIAQKGYRVNDWLPVLEESSLRTIDEIKGRMSVMNALINIAFEAPVYIIKEWIEEQNLAGFLSDTEKVIVEKDNEDLTTIEVNSLRWYLESLWALMWLTKMIDDLEPEKHVGDNMSSMLPNLQHGDDNKKLDNIQSVRSVIEIYTMLDYYFRLHWYCVDERLNGRKPKLNEGEVYQRRKALEWAYNQANDWDNVEMST